jgi:hypothetical protein
MVDIMAPNSSDKFATFGRGNETFWRAQIERANPTFGPPHLRDKCSTFERPNGAFQGPNLATFQGPYLATFVGLNPHVL